MIVMDGDIRREKAEVVVDTGPHDAMEDIGNVGELNTELPGSSRRKADGKTRMVFMPVMGVQ